VNKSAFGVDKLDCTAVAMDILLGIAVESPDSEGDKATARSAADLGLQNEKSKVDN
jgi:hypothetical protein